jgi:hypothetical protein
MSMSLSCTFDNLCDCHIAADHPINKIDNVTPREIAHLLHIDGGIIGQDRNLASHPT